MLHIVTHCLCVAKNWVQIKVTFPSRSQWAPSALKLFKYKKIVFAFPIAPLPKCSNSLKSFML